MPSGNQPLPNDIDKPTIGLIAAWGRYPIVVAEALRASGHKVCCAAVRHHADPALAEVCDQFQWVGAARIGQVVRYFQRHGVRQATMAGKIHKVEMYQPAGLATLPARLDHY